MLFLDHGGTVKSHEKISDTQGGFGGTLANGDQLGSSLASLGDVDGDAIPDLAVGAPLDGGGGADRGAVWVLFLDPDGSVQGEREIGDAQGGFTGSLDDFDEFGVALTGAGDVDGDGTGDLAVAAQLDDDGGADRGAVWVLFLDGQPLACGDGVLDPGEQCDDGGTAGFDGCTASCEIEDAIALYGVAETTGILDVRLDDVDLNVFTITGDTPTTLGPVLELVIDGNPMLMDLGTGAQASGNRVFVNGCFAMAESTAPGTTASIAPGTVVAHQKISETQGGFTGQLDFLDLFGESLASLPDLDGDGVTELAVGASRDDDGLDDAGAVWLLFLNTDGTIKGHQKISNTQGGLTGVLDASDQFGTSVGSLADLDGDGVGDLAIGAPIDGDGGPFRGAVWILFLNPNGTVKAEQKISDTVGGFGGGLSNFDNFGSSVAGLGDFDGDGVGDLAVGAVGDADAGDRRGAAWILFLNSDGTVRSHRKISATQGGFTGVLDNSDDFGSSVAFLGDLDGDGVGDLAVGARGDGAAIRGAVWVLFLNADGTVKSHQKINDTQGGFTGVLDEFARFGRSVTYIGDLDDDGVGDLAVGVGVDSDGGPSRGAAWILFLNADGTVKRHQKISDTQGEFSGSLGDADDFGSAVVSLGDLDGDGVGDLAVGALRDDDGGSTQGAVWVLSLDGAAALCGDAVLVVPEQCEDGNQTPGDGCFSTCRFEDEVEISGTAQGGVVQVVVDGIVVGVGTSSGQSAASVVANLAAAVSLSPDLQVKSVSAAGVGDRLVTDGTIDAITLLDAGLSVVAASTAHDGFDYAPAGADLLGLGTAEAGFAGGWSEGGFNAWVHDNYDVAAGSLEFPPLLTSGNRVESLAQTGGLAGITRRLAKPIGAAGTTRYLSVLLRPEGIVGQGLFNGYFGLLLDRTGDAQLFVGKGGADTDDYVLENRGGSQQVSTDVEAVADETIFLVLKAEFTAGADTLTLYVDPIPNLPEPASGTVKNDADVGIADALTIYSTGAFSLDELRVGRTFEDVTPLPEPAAPLGVLAGVLLLARLVDRRRRRR